MDLKFEGGREVAVVVGESRMEELCWKKGPYREVRKKVWFK